MRQEYHRVNEEIADREQALNNGGAVALCLDLDGTLVRSDLLVESIFSMVRRAPSSALRIPFWLLNGKAWLKRQIAHRADIRVDLLPYNDELLRFARSEKGQGRPVHLVTASNQKYANQVNEHLQLFDEVFASDDHVNLSSSNKAKLLVDTFGNQKFDYAGNSRKDIEVWKHARHALVVEPEFGVMAALQKAGRDFELISAQKSRFSALFRAMRPHQWLKNSIVLLPLLTAHLFTDIAAIINSLLAVIAFSLMASAGYLINDLFDLEADRLHKRKRDRPIARGDLSLAAGLASAPVLIISAMAVSLVLPSGFIAIITIYLAATLSYSLFLKKKVILDVIVLAGLYTLRVIGGAAALAVELSFWLLAFSMFFFVSLAFVKRFAELKALQLSGEVQAAGRGYGTEDLDLVRSLGVSAGYGAVVVLALYVNSPEISHLYTRPELIWLICPILLYWLARVWAVAHRGGMHHDPLVFALEDRVSQLSLLLAVLTVWFAM